MPNAATVGRNTPRTGITNNFDLNLTKAIPLGKTRRLEVDARIAAAGAFLRAATPRSNEERATKLMGLAWSRASQTEINRAAEALRAAQRPNGGWAQLDTLEADAYATGQAVYALRISGRAPASDPVIQRGAEYLLRTQERDGSWHVTTRSFPFQPYKESGFPHGKDQWI